MSLKNEKAKTLKLENENSFLKNSCEEYKKLLDAYKSSHDELKLNHETLFASHDELLEQHASLIKVFTKKLKNNENSSHGSKDQLQNVAKPYDVEKKHVSTSCDDLLDMPCSSHIDACSTSISCETNIFEGEHWAQKWSEEFEQQVREVLQLSSHLWAYVEQQKKLWWQEWHWLQKDQG